MICLLFLWIWNPTATFQPISQQRERRKGLPVPPGPSKEQSLGLHQCSVAWAGAWECLYPFISSVHFTSASSLRFLLYDIISWCPSCDFFLKLFQAFLVYFIFASTLCECYQSTWQWAPGQLAFSWKWTTWYRCDQYPSLSSGFYFILLAELGTWLVFPPSELLYMTLWSTYWISARLRFRVAGWRIRISGYHCINSS